MSKLLKIPQLTIESMVTGERISSLVFKDSDVKKIDRNVVVLKRKYGKFKRQPIRVIYE